MTPTEEILDAIAAVRKEALDKFQLAARPDMEGPAREYAIGWARQCDMVATLAMLALAESS